jgi:5-methylcytosine-specific restriction enzyme A
MPLVIIPDVDRDAIFIALDVFDRDHRDTKEWESWTEKENHHFAIEHDEKFYPVKFTVSLATGLHVGEMHAGWGSNYTNTYIDDRGFKIVELRESNPLRKRNPPWARDELILALDLYLENRASPPGQSSNEVQELSTLLNRLGAQLNAQSYEGYRNPNGVYMKLMNYRGLDDEHPGDGLAHAGRGDKEVWNEFSGDPSHCKKVAKTIRAAIEALEHTVEDEPDLEDEGITEAEEGRAVTRVHIRRERSRKLVARKKKSVLKKVGFLECEACGFRFDQVYGERGEGFIECHHTKPVHTLEPNEKTHIKDLSLLCSNCHRMIHAKRPWLSVEELRSIPELQKILINDEND